MDVTRTYQAQVESSSDGEVWQALDVPEIVSMTVEPADWFDAREAAEESGSAPGALTRILVWAADETDLTVDTAIYVAEYQTPAHVIDDRLIALEQARRMLGLATTDATGDLLRRWERKAKAAGRTLVAPVGREPGRGGMQLYRLGDVLAAMEAYGRTPVEMPED